MEHTAGATDALFFVRVCEGGKARKGRAGKAPLDSRKSAAALVKVSLVSKTRQAC